MSRKVKNHPHPLPKLSKNGFLFALGEVRIIMYICCKCIKHLYICICIIWVLWGYVDRDKNIHCAMYHKHVSIIWKDRSDEIIKFCTRLTSPLCEHWCISFSNLILKLNEIGWCVTCDARKSTASVRVHCGSGGVNVLFNILYYKRLFFVIRLDDIL